MLNRQQQLAIFRAETENSRELDAAWLEHMRAVNEELRRGRRARGLTRSLALLFSAWAEVNFAKLIHTPHGFDLDEIEQISRCWSRQGIGEGWLLALELGLRQASKKGHSNNLPNVRQAIERIIQTYVVEPSQVRNKVAHGQWRVALNHELTAVNAAQTARLVALDCVKVDLWREASRTLAEMMSALISSPDRAFFRDFWTLFCRLKEELERRERWTLESKIELLRGKASRAAMWRNASAAGTDMAPDTGA